MDAPGSLMAQLGAYVGTMGIIYSSWGPGMLSVVLAIAASVVIIVIYVLLAHFKGMRLSKRAVRVCGVLSIANLILFMFILIYESTLTPGYGFSVLGHGALLFITVMLAVPFVLMNVILGSASFVSAAWGKERAPSTSSPVLEVLCAFVYESLAIVLPVSIVWFSLSTLSW